MANVTFGMLVFPRMTQLDFTGPYEVFCRIPGAKVVLVGREVAPMPSEHGLVFQPDVDFAHAPPLDVLFVPGGGGVDAAMDDDATLDFLAERGGSARYVTSVCTGALALGAAGLLRGYRATTHWLSLPLLSAFGATPVEDARVVIDRNRITGGGVTAGIDFALHIASELAGEDEARAIQLMIEYAPAPPLTSGTPREARAETTALVRERRRAAQDLRRELVERVVSRRHSR